MSHCEKFAFYNFRNATQIRKFSKTSFLRRIATAKRRWQATQFRKLRFYSALRKNRNATKIRKFSKTSFWQRIATAKRRRQATHFRKFIFQNFKNFIHSFLVFGLFFAIHLQGAHIQVTVHIQLLIFRYLLQFHIQVTIHIQLHLISYLLHPVRIEPTTFYMLQDWTTPQTTRPSQLMLLIENFRYINSSWIFRKIRKRFEMRSVFEYFGNTAHLRKIFRICDGDPTSKTLRICEKFANASKCAVFSKYFWQIFKVIYLGN